MLTKEWQMCAFIGLASSAPCLSDHVLYLLPARLPVLDPSYWHHDHSSSRRLPWILWSSLPRSPALPSMIEKIQGPSLKNMAFLLNHSYAVFPEGIPFTFQPQLLFASRVSIVSSLTIIFCAPSSPQAAQTANSVPWSVPLAIASPSGAREAVIPLSPFLLQRLCLCHRPHHIPSSLNPRNPPKKTKTFSSVYHILFKTQTHDLRRRVNCRIWGSSMSRAVETVCDGNWSDSDNCMAQ